MGKNAQKHLDVSSSDLGFAFEELQGESLEFFAREGARILREHR